MENPELYAEYNSLPEQDANTCLCEYGGRVQWRGRDRVIDLGCGNGYITARTLRTFLPSDFAQLVGCDSSARMVRHARAVYEDKHTTFCEMDLGTPLPQNMKGNFDHAFSFHAMHWTMDQKRVFTNIFELLAPGGDCLLMFMTRQPIVDTFRMVGAQATGRARTRLPGMRYLVYHDSQQPEEEVRILMENVGFKDLMVERKVMKYTYDNLYRYIGSLISDIPFDFEDLPSDIQAVRDLRLPMNRVEESDAPGQGHVHQEYGVIVARARKPMM